MEIQMLILESTICYCENNVEKLKSLPTRRLGCSSSFRLSGSKIPIFLVYSHTVILFSVSFQPRERFRKLLAALRNISPACVLIFAHIASNI